MLLLESADFTVQPIDAFVRCGIFFDGDADYFTSFCIVAMLSKFGVIRTAKLNEQSIKRVRMRYTPLLQDLRHHSSIWGSGLRRAVSKLMPISLRACSHFAAFVNAFVMISAA